MIKKTICNYCGKRIFVEVPSINANTTGCTCNDCVPETSRARNGIDESTYTEPKFFYCMRKHRERAKELHGLKCPQNERAIQICINDNTTNNRVAIELPNGFKLVAEKSTDPLYSREMHIGIVDADGVWCQDLAIVRSSYQHNDGIVAWNDERFDVLVYGDKGNEDYTNKFTIGLYRESE